MFVVIADDEFRFRKTVIQWIAKQYNLSDSARDSAISQIGSEDSADHLVVHVSERLRFLLVGRLETLWQHVQQETKEEDRILILLDLGWGDKDALKELARLRSDAQLRHFPVIIYSKSDAESDIKRCYDATANAYMVKKGSMQVRRDHFFRAINHWSGTTGDYRPPYAAYAA
jgi:DNA-binding NarL/FixJ family response regulator